MQKLCIWMNIPSHYQRALFAALRRREDVDLEVRYFSLTSAVRKDEGWEADCQLEPFEQSVAGAHSAVGMLEALPDWRDRVHIIGSNFHPELVDYLCRVGAVWCHWSEMPGIRLADFLQYRMGAYRFLSPLMLRLKYREARRISSHALGALGQGLLARRAFELMGLSANKISDLYYSPLPLSAMRTCEKVAEFAGGRRVFLSVGALCKRKGIDVLLKAFAALKTDDWCLVLCGLDRSGGEYEALAATLGVRQQVLFLGAYPVKQIAAVYCAADVFVLASYFDGWGTVLNEAASLGLPIIGTDMCGAAWHLINDGVNGFRVKAGSVPELYQAMRTYIDDPDLVDLHGESSKTIYSDSFTPEKNAERLITALRGWQVKAF